jgi:hypothetical protein
MKIVVDHLLSGIVEKNRRDIYDYPLSVIVELAVVMLDYL